jgi:hypothetical protein
MEAAWRREVVFELIQAEGSIGPGSLMEFVRERIETHSVQLMMETKEQQAQCECHVSAALRHLLWKADVAH